MATITKQFLSASTQGKGIKVTTTATDGTGDAGLSTGNPLHVAVSGTTDIDEVWIYASNTSASDVILTIEFGDDGGVEHNIVTTLAASSTELVVPGLILHNGLNIRAFAATEDVITIFGYANRMDY
tara:strand:+ start:2307 stop:2684 length:378 start_codon:yes stop_codon:yes gene_type:complete